MAGYSRRVVVLYVDDTDAAEDLTGALTLLIGPSYLPYPEDATPTERKGPQPQMSDQQRKEIALEWLWRSRHKIHHGAQLLLPADWKNDPS